MRFGVFHEQFGGFRGEYEITWRVKRCRRITGNQLADAIVTKRGDIIVLHFAGQMPLAGIAWQAMHYLVGLERLGYRCWYIEDGGANPFDPRANSIVMTCDYNVRCLKQAMEEYGFGERWSYWDAIHDVHYGLSHRQVGALLLAREDGPLQEFDGLLALP